MTTLFSFDQFLPQPAVFELKNPATDKPLLDDKKKPIWVKLVGLDTEQFFKASLENTKRKKELGEQANEPGYGLIERAHFLSALITDWHPALGLCTPEAVFDKFSKFNYAPYAEQVEAFASERANFFPE